MYKHRKRKLRGQVLKKQKRIVALSIIGSILFLTIGYAAFSTNITLTAKGNTKDRSRIIQTRDINYAFWNEEIRTKVISVTFLDTARVPDNAYQSWDVSVARDKGVMAYVTINEQDNTKLDLFIGAKHGVIANQASLYLFRAFTSVVSINFDNNFDTSNVIDMQGMFWNCPKLEELDLSCFKTNQVTNMSSMFRQCSVLSTVNLTNFDTSNVTNMGAMFRECFSIEELDLSGFRTSNLQVMNSMFEQCYNLVKINISNFDTSNVINMSAVFRDCHSLTELNLCSFDISKVTSLWYMFADTTNMKNIYVGTSWNMDNIYREGIFKDSGVSSVTTGFCS